MLTQEELKKRLHYDPVSGVFTRLTKTNNVQKMGTIDEKGRLHIGVKYNIYRAHRLAWLYVHGEWPKGDVDHIDGNPLNNAIANLRDVSRSVNMQNQRRARADSKTGLLGVYRRTDNRTKPYRAAIVPKNGKRVNLGNFASAEAAHAAYLAAKRQLHEGCTL